MKTYKGNQALVFSLADPVKQAKLLSICLSLNRRARTYSLDPGKTEHINLLDKVFYGANHPVFLRTIYDLLNSPGKPRPVK